MSKRFWTADFHLGMDAILEWEKRPFQSTESMNEAYLGSCAANAGDGDLIVHLGDLACFNPDSHGGSTSAGLGRKPSEMVNSLRAQFMNVRGNHDPNNKVFSACESLRTSLGKKYPDVSASHYPSYDRRGHLHWLNGDIHLCGHVHRKWKHCFDVTNRVLNINVGVDVWEHRIVSEEELTVYIGRLLRLPTDRLFKCQVFPGGSVRFFGEKGKYDGTAAEAAAGAVSNGSA